MYAHPTCEKKCSGCYDNSYFLITLSFAYLLVTFNLLAQYSINWTRCMVVVIQARLIQTVRNIRGGADADNSQVKDVIKDVFRN